MSTFSTTATRTVDLCHRSADLTLRPNLVTYLRRYAHHEPARRAARPARLPGGAAVWGPGRLPLHAQDPVRGAHRGRAAAAAGAAQDHHDSQDKGGGERPQEVWLAFLVGCCRRVFRTISRHVRFFALSVFCLFLSTWKARVIFSQISGRRDCPQD